MTTVYYIRHAQPNFDNHDDLSRELTKKGASDSQRLVPFFRDMTIDAVFSSPYRRAVDTVRPIAEAKGLPISFIADFRERKVTDEWIVDFQGFARRQWEDFSYKLPDGESLLEVQARNITALEHLLEQHSNQTILIGGHGTALGTILNYYHPEFGYTEFQKLQPIMPCILRFRFSENQCMDIQWLPLP